MKTQSMNALLNAERVRADNWRRKYEEEHRLRLEIQSELNRLKGAVMGAPKGNYTNATHEPSDAIGEARVDPRWTHMKRGIR